MIKASFEAFIICGIIVIIPYIFMLKEAKSPPDAVQQKLRQNKKAWNAVVKAFIDDLIHYKKLMNGAPSKFFKEKGTIKDPIPADPATIIGSLASDFQEIALQGNAIIQEQANYSKNRRKKRPKQTAMPLPTQTGPVTPPPAQTPPTPNLEQQLAVPLAASAKYKIIKMGIDFEDKYSLEKEASNPISRFFTRLLTPTFGFGKATGVRRARMAMLNSSASLFKGLEHLQAEIMNSAKTELGLSAKMAMKLFHEWRKVKLGFDAAAKLLPQAPVESGGHIDTPSLPKQDRDKSLEVKPTTAPKTEAPPTRSQNFPDPDHSVDTLFHIADAKKYIDDYTKALSSGALAEDVSSFQGLNAAINKFQMTQSHESAANVISEYGAVLVALNGKYNSTASNLQTIALERTANNHTQQLEVLSQLFLKKWWGKGKHQISSDETSSLRLSVYDEITETREVLDQIMDLLEDGLDTQKLEPLISDVNGKMSRIRMTVRTLAISYGGVSESRLPLH